MKMKYTEQAVETLDDAGSVIANKNIEIEQLRQRVAELEENWRLSEVASAKRQMNVIKLTAERDALKQQRDDLRTALELCIPELRGWMNAHGEDIGTIAAIKAGKAAIKAGKAAIASMKGGE